MMKDKNLNQSTIMAADFVTPLLLVHRDLQRSFTRSENLLLGHEEDLVANQAGAFRSR